MDKLQTTAVIAPNLSSSGQPETIEDYGDKTYISVIRYMPHQVRGESINLAVVLQNPNQNYAGIKIRPRMDADLESIWPLVDSEGIRLRLRALEDEIKRLDRATKKDSSKRIMFESALVSKPSYLEKFKKGYSSIYIDPPKPVRVKDGEKFREVLSGMFDLYINIDDPSARRSNITKDVIRFSVAKEIERISSVVVESPVVEGRYFRNRFDFGKYRPSNLDSMGQIITFDTKDVDSSIGQTMKLIKSIEDIREAHQDGHLEYGVLLQPPVTVKENKDDYDRALKALRDHVKVIQNFDGLDGLTRSAARFAELLVSEKGFHQAG